MSNIDILYKYVFVYTYIYMVIYYMNTQLYVMCICKNIYVYQKDTYQKDVSSS